MVYIYILKCECGKYYVGKSVNPLKRINEHMALYGSEWTRKYKPIEILKILPNCDDDDEDKYTIRYMKEYGIDNVRGGTFVRMELTKAEKEVLIEMIRGYTDACFRCGRTDHFVKNCPYDTENSCSCGILSQFMNKIVTYFTKQPASVCYRCGRKEHYSSTCYAHSHIDGRILL